MEQNDHQKLVWKKIILKMIGPRKTFSGLFLLQQLTNCFVGKVTRKNPSEVPSKRPRLPHESPQRTRCGKFGKMHWGSQGDLEAFSPPIPRWIPQFPAPPVSFDSSLKAWPIFTKESWNGILNALTTKLDHKRMTLSISWQSQSFSKSTFPYKGDVLPLTTQALTHPNIKDTSGTSPLYIVH